MTVQPPRRGFTLVELLVVIAIIGVLVALLLPAVQATREAARRTQCKNHLRQFAQATHAHHDAVGHFPTGGWGRLWVGDKDRGFGQKQPGNWAFNLLPFLEETSAYDMAGDGLPEVITDQQREGARRLIEQPFEIFNCPSRRSAVAYPTLFDDRHIVPPRAPLNAVPTYLSAKLDYAINQGDLQGTAGAGPDRMEEWETHFGHDRLGNGPFGRGGHSPLTGEWGYNGISFPVSEVSIRHVTDGTANTYLIGEKYANPAHYDTDENWSDNHAWCTGADYNAFRTGFEPPMQDRYGIATVWRFGSAHAGGMHMAYCDGSVRVVSYDIERTVHMATANRHDGTAHGIGATILDYPTSPPIVPPPRP